MSPEEFHNEFAPEFAPETSAYGNTVYPVKPGLTRRGKVALAVGVTVIASGGMLTWQHYSAQAQENGIKAQELALKQQELRIQELKEINKATAAQSKEQDAEDADRKKFVDACVQADKSLIGKQMGVKYSSVVADCQAQYQGGQTSVAGADMAAVGAAAGTVGGGGASINSTGLLAIAAGGGVLVLVAARRTKKVNAK
ncbi:hypothetical protein OV320_2668 [Actinobacteria bacterium OV320]|jgi:hypothetical protein|nr:hypothetical protein OV320_2668 [Actinobacteria bacterium OV320]